MGAPVSDVSTGYVRLYRKLLNNPVWTQLVPAVAKVAIFFLLRASYKPSQWWDGSKTVEIPAGGFITSYARTAEACNLSVQQVRDAFTHLFGTHFATYARTKRWTLVTVLNWATYQASDDDAEHAKEHRPDRVKNRKGTTDKELRIKNTPLPPRSEGHGAGAPLELTGPDPNEKPRGTTAGRKSYRDVLEQVARTIHGRHPNALGRRDLGVGGIEKKLEAILKHKHIPSTEAEAYLQSIDRNHAAACNSEGWCKDGGQYAKALRNYLAPTEDRYEIEPSAPQRSEPVRLMA